MAEIAFKEITADRGRICESLLRALPTWFGIEAAILQYIKDVEGMTTFAAFSGRQAVGFLSLNRHSEWTAEVHVVAMHPSFHRMGIGRKLTEMAEAYLLASGFEFLSVKTISPAHPDKGYALTRKFYLEMGFRVVEEFKTLWGASNPCWLLIKRLR